MGDAAELRAGLPAWLSGRVRTTQKCRFPGLLECCVHLACCLTSGSSVMKDVHSSPGVFCVSGRDRTAQARCCLLGAHAVHGLVQANSVKASLQVLAGSQQGLLGSCGQHAVHMLRAWRDVHCRPLPTGSKSRDVCVSPIHAMCSCAALLQCSCLAVSFAP